MSSSTHFIIKLIQLITTMLKLVRASLALPTPTIIFTRNTAPFSFKKRLMEYAAKRSEEEAKLRNPNTPS